MSKRAVLVGLVVCAAVSPSLAEPEFFAVNNYYYHVAAVPGGVTWEQANALAQQSYYLGLQGHLAVITSAAENKYITEHMMRGKLDTAWIGGFQLDGSPEPDQGWQWVSQERWAHNNWLTGTPDDDRSDDGLNENAVQLFAADYWWVDARGKWNDLPKEILLPGYIIEYGLDFRQVTVETLPPRDLQGRSAVLRGELVEDAGEACEYRFFLLEKGKGHQMVRTDWQCCVTTGQGFEFTATGLLPGTIYYCCAFARNSIMLDTTPWLRFTTPVLVIPSGEFVLVSATPEQVGALTGTAGGATDLGNLIETESGWQGVSAPLNIAGNKRLRTQWSWIGPDTGDLRLLPTSPQDQPWRHRALKTISAGSFYIEGAKEAKIPVRARVNWDSEFVGFAVANAGAAVLDLVPALAANLPGAPLSELPKAVATEILGKLAGLQADAVVAKGSQFETSTSAGVQFFQGGAAVAPLGSTSTGLTQIGGPVVEARSAAGEWTFQIDPSKPIDFNLELGTKAGADGSAWAYAVLRQYRITLDVPDRGSTPLVIEQTGSIPDVSGPVYKQLLMATAQTPQFTAGQVTQVKKLGHLAGTLGHKLIVLQGKPVSGFIMPVTLTNSSQVLVAEVAALCSDPALAGEAGVSLAYANAAGIFPMWEGSLKDMFAFDQVSGVAEMPAASALARFELPITALPRGEGMFLVAFGSAPDSALRAALAIDQLAVISASSAQE